MTDEAPEPGAGTPEHRPLRRGKAALAYIEARTLGAGLDAEALRRALVPGTRKEHYHREWIMGRITDDAGCILGRIGFHRTVRGGGWDEEAGDLVPVDREDVVISPFAIDRETLRIAFQTRGNEIKSQSFVGAFQALLDAASPVERWRVYHEKTEEPFEQWLSRVGRIERVRVRVRRPNPHYTGREVEDFVEGLNAKSAEISARADPDDPQGIDRHDAFLEQMVAHAERYGSYEVVGTDDEGARVEYRSTRHVEELEVQLDPATGEAPPAELRRALEHGHEDDPATG
jgi:hypothetical protein